MIGVSYPDEYAVEETFQLLKVPWEWYDPAGKYDVVIADRARLKRDDLPVIDLAQGDVFGKVSDTLNLGLPHNHEPTVDMDLERLRSSLREHTLLVEIPPIPWGNPFIVAVTHDVDILSAAERPLASVGYAACRCLGQGEPGDAARILCAKLGIGKDPWYLMDRWMALEEELGIRSSFYFIPFRGMEGQQAPKTRACGYDLDPALLRRLAGGGWEVGVHGIDSWVDPARAAGELARFRDLGIPAEGGRIHWLLRGDGSWRAMDGAGYLYDTSFGYDDDVGFRAGTLQVYRPRGCDRLLELPLHIQDHALFASRCWIREGEGWSRVPCLHLSHETAWDRCGEILSRAGIHGGVVTLLWHHESLAPPWSWGALYLRILQHARSRSAWIARGRDAVEWFRMRRNAKIHVLRREDRIIVTLENPAGGGRLPPMRIRVHIDPARVREVDGEWVPGPGYVDLRADRPAYTLVMA